MKRSTAPSWTRIRERAQQSWPALPNTAIGAAAAAASRSASAKMTLADLPPELERHPLDRLGRTARRSSGPTSVEPVKAIFATSGCSTRRCPQVRPGPTTTFTTPSGSPASSASSEKRRAVSGVSSAGFRTTVFPAASAGRELPGGDRQREVPGGDQSDDAERLADGEGLPARDRDRVAEQPLGRARRSSGRCRRPSPSRRGRRRWPCRRCAPRVPRAPRGGAASVSATECSRRARSPGASARQPGRAAFAAATARSTSSGPARGISASTASVAGSRTESWPLTVQPSVRVRDPQGPSWQKPTLVPLWRLSDVRQGDFRVEVVDRPDRALERLFRRYQVPDGHREHRPDRHDRRVVHS